jgi:Cu(I)/Ag(I) efflux system membrane fusion protein
MRHARLTSLLLLVLAGTLGPWTCMHGSSAAEAPATGTADAAVTWYTCAMHPDVIRDAPGDCPRCGMRLQPIPPDRAAAMGLAGATRPADPKPSSGERKVLYWKSSMIPGEVHQEPGKDSMGMDLVPVYEDEVSAGNAIRIDPVIEQDMGVRFATVTRGPLRRTVRAVGYVAYDETTLAVISTKVDGWIEKLHLDQTGAQVHGGDPLFDLYAPELFSAQEEYLAALRGRQTADVPAVPGSRLDSEDLVRAARTRLEYFDVPDEQIRTLEQTRRIRKTLTIKAPFTGIVTEKNVIDGQMVKAGSELFRIADLSTVWVIAKVFEQDVPYVAVGQEALMTLSYLPGRTFRGRVTYVYPYLETNTREVSVRLEFHNPGYELKPGMYTTVTLVSEVAGEATLVPDTAILRTGTRDVVFVRTAPGRFEPREVRLGLRSEGNRVQVLSGVAPGETVVVSGQFLLDSESRLREAALKMIEPGRASGATPIESVTPGLGGEEPAATTAHGRTYWVCPMPAHVDILYDQPGTCPLCGMQLVPVERKDGHVEGPHIAYWTCPMPEHRSVHEPGPGKCPICGMTLIPVPKTP